MTKEEQIAAMRDAIAKIIAEQYSMGRISKITYSVADLILALPNIAVLDENQELPWRDFSETQAKYERRMKAEGWKKVLK